MKMQPNPLEHRKAAHPIDDMFLKRWSPRAMSGERVSKDELNQLFEAARWAPSTYNEQEWRFLYAHRDSAAWDDFFSLLVEANQAWCGSAGILVVVLSHKVFEKNGKPNPVHTFDAGAAFENFALQGAAMQLVVHAMAGFNRSKTRSLLQIPEEFAIEAMIAVGRPGKVSDLPDDLREREKPTGRKPIEEFTCEGKFDLPC